MVNSVSRQRLLIGLQAGAIASVVVLALMATDAIQTVERKTGDARLRFERAIWSAATTDSTLVIIDIDNRSLRLYERDLGRWPWPRNAHGAMLEFIGLGDPELVVYDVLFSEPDLARPQADSLFFVAARRGPPVVHAVAFDDPEGETAIAELERAFIDRDRRLDALERFALPEGTAVSAPLFANVNPPVIELLDSAIGIGAINRAPDRDGVERLEPLLIEYGNRLYPSMGLAAALGGPRGYDRLQIIDGELSLDGRSVPLEAGRLRPHWRGRYGESYRVIAAHEVLNSYAQIAVGAEPDLDPAELTDRIVLIGSSATGVGDFVAGPFSPTEPGVFLHATILDTLRSGDFLRVLPIGWVVFLTLLAACITGVVIAFVRSARRSAVALTGTLLAIGVLAMAAFVIGGWLAPVVAPATGAVLAYAGAMAGSYVVEGRRHRQIRRMFAKFIPPEVANQLAESGADLHRAVERREVTVLFSDIRDFTTRSEGVEPEIVVDTLNEYLTAMVEVLFDHGGTLDKYLGDGLMAFFGAPVVEAEHATQACRAAIGMLDRLETLNKEWATTGRPRLNIGIGIHTGPAVVGFIGDPDRRMDYTAIGDTVNVASRLEALNKEIGTAILLSAATAQKLDGALPLKSIGERAVKGRAEPIELYTITA